MTTCRKSASLKPVITIIYFTSCKSYINFDTPLRRCSCLLAATRPAFLPRDRSLAASGSSCSSLSSLGCLAAAVVAAAAARAMPTDHHPIAWPTPLGRSGPSSAARRWSMADRPTATSTAAASPSAASRSPARSATTGEAAAIPSWNGRSSKPWSGAFVAWTMAHSGVSASDFPRDGQHGGYLASLYDRQQKGGRVLLRAARSPTSIHPSRATSCAAARPGRPGAMPIRGPRGGASTAPPAIATSSPTCAAATCTQSAAT